MNASDLKEGESAAVSAVRADDKTAKRLAMLNVYPGAEISLVRRAPFGGGIMLEAGGVRLSVGRKTAGKISVRKERRDGQTDR